MDDTEIKHVVEAALLAAGRPLTLDGLGELFASRGDAPDKATLKRALETLRNEYQGRGIEIKEVASGYRVQVKRTMTDWLQPLWEERAPRYTRALLETLALVAYRQPITRAEIEEVRGVVVSTNIVRTLLERNWIRVVGHRDVPGKPAMFGTTKEFLDYFGLKKLEDLPTLADIKDGFPELSPQTDLLETLAAGSRVATAAHDEDEIAASASAAIVEATLGDDDDNRNYGVSLSVGDEADEEPADAGNDAAVDDDTDERSADVIPLRAADDQ
jgi:segregation and condensation protein B